MNVFSWDEHIKPYQELLERVKNKLEKANNRFQRQLGYSPIEEVRFRIKSEASTQAKLEEKGLKFSKENLSEVKDLAGIRIICKFLDDIPEILSIIHSWQNIKVINNKDSLSYEQVKIVDEKDYLSKPKESGYRSYHIVCEEKGLVFEIQIRTLAMNFWATSEHMLKYKYGGKIPENIQEKLRSIADIISTLDNSMNDIRQDVNIGTVKSRVLEQLYKSIHILESINMKHKADYYREQLEKSNDDIEALRSLAIRAKEEVPKQYWED
jgi:putative GTP pyrophosphokinase